MKKILLSLAFAVLCTLSFGQNITNINFTGILAKTTFGQFSISTANNGTIATAGKSWVSAIAAPTVDVTNIADMALTISSGATLVTAQSTNGAPITTTTVPTNYTNSVQLLSGTLEPLNFANVYIGNTAGTAYRNVAIFIHKLTPATLPIVVGAPSVQPGFAQCGEVVNAGTNVQLHTNDQAIYLAFNSAADVVKFQVENSGTVGDVNANAYIYVEKSADLTTWTSLQNIQLEAPQNPAIRTNYAITINDAAARYIRLRIAGLANSRSSRKENIRSISVLSKPVITWNQDLTGLKTTDSQVTLTASSTVSSATTPAAGTDITYISSDQNVVSVTGNVLTVVAVGEATITAKQAANANYSAAADVVQNVKVVDLGTGIFNVTNDVKLVFGTPKGIVSSIDGTLQVYSTTGILLKNQLVSKNQLLPMTSGAYIVRASVNGKSISQVIVL